MKIVEIIISIAIFLTLVAVVLSVISLFKQAEKYEVEKNQKITDCIERGNEVSWCLEVI